MITTILSLLGGGLGALMRFVPEILKLWTAGKDQAHEYKMTTLQLEIDKARAGQAIDLVHAQGEMTIQAGEMQAYIEAIKGQGRITGVAWADALNATVRPFITYWWMALFTIAKIVSVWIAVSNYSTLSSFLDAIWTSNDVGILSMILGFWFVDRSIRKGRE